MPVNQIVSDTLISIEQHFRISAGPGAGKTHWLASHIQNVLQNSKRLGCNKKIACITYTNVAVDTILKRLNFVADRVEISTIHSFIYKNIVKPYVSFIAAEFELNVGQMDGHDDHLISRKKITEWITNHQNASRFTHPYNLNQLIKIEKNLEGVGNWLSSLHYKFNGDHLELAADNGHAYYYEGAERTNLGRAACLDKLAPGFVQYKKIFWRKGVLHHDDVLYFGYTLLKRFPFILSVLRAKFPYFFIDEFQDTTPVQAAILKLLGEHITIVGIIGDKAQSIFSFQGASSAHFEQFSLTNLESYFISDNRRSTNLILNVLNHIRKDITQRPVRNITGTKPVILVGNMESAYLEATRLSDSETITTLSWDNITANAMKRQLNSSLPSQDLIQGIINKDSSSDRRRIIVSCLKAVELARQKRFKEAIKEMERNFRTVKNKDELKKIAFGHLSLLLSKYDSYAGSPLLEFYSLVKLKLRPNITKLTRGVAIDFYQSHTYEQLAVCIKIDEDDSPNRTIHKSKGDEFENVLLILKKQLDLNFLLNPDLSVESHRLFYVAVSRAINRLFITVPELNAVSETRLNSLFDVAWVG
jgi:DNA helicase-2/ATP-dependent DNA helicase PcrA